MRPILQPTDAYRSIPQYTAVCSIRTQKKLAPDKVAHSTPDARSIPQYAPKPPGRRAPRPKVYTSVYLNPSVREVYGPYTPMYRTLSKLSLFSMDDFGTDNAFAARPARNI